MKKLIAIIPCLFMLFPAMGALNLTGTAAIEKSANTAAEAKSAAMGAARRQITEAVLSRYADRNAVADAIAGAPDAELLDLVATSSIYGEKSSGTAYSADFEMTLDRTAAETWLRAKDIPDYMSAADDAGGKIPVFITMDGGLRPLADLMGKLREAGADKALEIRIIRGPDVTAALSVSARAAFIGAAGALGWKVSDANGTLNVSNSRQ